MGFYGWSQLTLDKAPKSLKTSAVETGVPGGSVRSLTLVPKPVFALKAFDGNQQLRF